MFLYVCAIWLIAEHQRMRTLLIRLHLLRLLWVKKRVINAFHAKMKAESRYAGLGERLCCFC